MNFALINQKSFSEFVINALMLPATSIGFKKQITKELHTNNYIS